MAVRLITNTEKFWVEIEGSDFCYKRMPADMKTRLFNKHKKRGVIDYDAAAEASVPWGLLDWGKRLPLFGETEDGEAVEVPFERRLVETLPGVVRAELGSLIISGETEDSPDPS